MSKHVKDDLWETKELGASAEHAKVPDNHESFSKMVDDSLELQMISIRLPKNLIEQFKLIAEAHGLGYQPLMRIALARFAEYEIKHILRQVAEKQSAGEKIIKPIKGAA